MIVAGISRALVSGSSVEKLNEIYEALLYMAAAIIAFRKVNFIYV
jgi:hypothetical protein